MRDTARARVTRASDSIQAMADTLKRGTGKAIERAQQFATFATAPVIAPDHGAEYVRSVLYFTKQLSGDDAVGKLAEGYDTEGVIWRPEDQVNAARKQVGRLRSDALHAKPQVTDIPVSTMVYATDASDFIGSTYVKLEEVTIPLDGSLGDPIKVRVGRSTVPVSTGQLRYVEGPMIRTR